MTIHHAAVAHTPHMVCALSSGNYSACGTFDLYGFCGRNTVAFPLYTILSSLPPPSPLQTLVKNLRRTQNPRRQCWVIGCPSCVPTMVVGECGCGKFIELLEIDLQFGTIFHSPKNVCSTLVVNTQCDLISMHTGKTSLSPGLES